MNFRLIFLLCGLTFLRMRAAEQYPAVHHNWTRTEVMDSNGLFTLEWHVQNKEIIFKATVNTRGFIAIGFQYQGMMINGYDLAVAWVDDRSGKTNILDCHGKSSNFEGAMQDDTQNYLLMGNGHQNLTHTIISFKRSLETCDPRDVPLTADTTKIFWAFGTEDIVPEQISRLNYKTKGLRTMHLLSPNFKKPRNLRSNELHQWDVTLKNISIDTATDTLYWCKILKAPTLLQKHHIIGYEGLLSRESSTKKPLVHHMTLFECKLDFVPGFDSSSWEMWAKNSGSVCNSNSLTPVDWDSCITPVAMWGLGSVGQFFPEHVGIPMGGKNGAKYYMLEVHYDNPNRKRLQDHSGFRIHYTSQLRPNDGGMMIAGVSVSDTQMIPPGQKLYRNVGICGPSCTGAVFPESGINIVSAALHSHTAGRKIKLRHVRNGKELDRIVEDNHYQHTFQQARQLENETTVLPGDYIIIDCSYETLSRKRPTLGGYSTKQEMCLSFITYYPKIDLVGCYSMTPVKEFFEMFGVYDFYSLNMTDVENLFLYRESMNDILPSTLFPNYEHGGDLNDENNRLAVEALKNAKEYSIVQDEEDQLYKKSILNRLVISDPVEFHDRTFMSHLNQLPWSEPLFTRRVEQTILTGKHMAFCRVTNYSHPIPPEIMKFPNFTSLVMPASFCPYQTYMEFASSATNLKLNNLFFYILISTFILIYKDFNE